MHVEGMLHAVVHVIDTCNRPPALPLPQVLKKRLAVNVPMVLCNEFMYEEGEGLEEDEVGQLGAILWTSWGLQGSWCLGLGLST